MADFDIEEHICPISRSNIPRIRVSDGPNGIKGTKSFDSVSSACFPCGTALAYTFNKKLLEEAGELMGVEAKNKGISLILSPTSNIQSGPLCGRGFESFGEDPYLAGIVSAAIVNGIQPNNIAATIKHFVANELEEELNSSDPILTERALREIYSEPFCLAVKHAKPKVFTTGYNKTNGEHVFQSKRILQEILCGEWSWDSTIMSDWYGKYTTEIAIKHGLLIISDANIPENSPENTENNIPKTSKKIRKLISESIILSNNDNNILPLKKNEKVAIITPNANKSAYCGGGPISLFSYYNTTPFENLASQTINPITVKTGFNLKFFNEKPSAKEKNLFDERNVNQSMMMLFDYYHPSDPKNLYYIDSEGNLTVGETADYEFDLIIVGTVQLFVDGKLVVGNKTKQVKGNTFYNKKIQ